MKKALIWFMMIFPGMLFSQCPGIQMQALPFGGVEVGDSANSVADSVCGFEYPCDSARYFAWFQFQDTFYNGMKVSIESSRADSASILLVTGCNVILFADCRDIDFAQEVHVDHIGGVVSIHIAVPNPAKVTVRVQHATQPTQPPSMNFAYSCGPTPVDEPPLIERPRQRAVYYYIDTHQVIIR